MKLLSIIARTVRKIHLICPTLNIAASVLMKLTKFVGWCYTREWSYFHLPWYDQRFAYLLGPNRWYWAERGILGNRAIKEGDAVLDLCCGDGMYSGLFYSTRAGYVRAIDRDKRAIDTARRRYARPNVRYLQYDLNTLNLLQNTYNVVTLFAAIEHFSAEDGTRLLANIAQCLKDDGVFIGSTILRSDPSSNYEHLRMFATPEELREVLTPHFSSVELWVSKWPNRDECYFWCRK